jgi:hypothetical protein
MARSKSTEKAAEQIRAVLPLGAGQFFADQATLRGQEGALTCHVVTRSILFAVDRTSLRDLPEAGPA